MILSLIYLLGLAFYLLFISVYRYLQTIDNIYPEINSKGECM